MLKNKSILHITTVHKPNDNRIYYKECRSLKTHFKFVTLYSTFKFTGTESEVRHIQKMGFKNRFFRMLFVSFFGVLKNTLFTNYDLYHFHDPEIIPAGIILRLFGKKVIYDAHENLPGAIMSKPYLNPSTRKYLSAWIGILERYITPIFSAVITARPDIAEYLKNKHVVVIRNLPELPSFSPIVKPASVKTDKVRIIYVGGITQIRGIKELIQSMTMVSNAELLLLGPFETSFREECERLSGWKYVKYLGIVNADKVLEIISTADIGIINFLPEPNHLTTLATKPFEYMACGLPMVMSDFTYWKDFFQESAVYVNPIDAKDVARGINELINNPNLKLQMGEKNQQIIYQELNWEKESEKLISLYNTILS